MADAAPSFFETACQIAHARFPVVVRTHTLIDTTDHTDAVLIGLDGPTPVDERDGLLVVIKDYSNGRREMVVTGPEGEVEFSQYALEMLAKGLKSAGGA